MSAPIARSVGCPEGPRPRTHGTPSGYRNVRVLTPCSLHFRLVAYAGLSMLSLNEFILRVLNLATPIDPATGRPVPVSTLESAPGPRPGHDQQGGPGAAKGPSAAQMPKEPAPCQQPASDPLDGPGPAAGPGAPPSPKALARSSPDETADPARSGSFPTVDPVESPSVHDPDPARAGGRDHV